MRYALVKDGEVLEYRDYAPVGDQSKLAAGKPRMLPVEVSDPDFDPATQIKTGPEIVVQKDKVVERYTVASKSLDDRKTEMQAAIRAKRWEIETGGISFGGATIRTDEVSQAKLNGAVALFDKDPTLTGIDWEAAPGVWTQVSKDAVTAIGIAVGRHVQACFSRSRELSEAVAAAKSHQALSAINIADGWE